MRSSWQSKIDSIFIVNVDFHQCEFFNVLGISGCVHVHISMTFLFYCSEFYFMRGLDFATADLSFDLLQSVINPCLLYL